MFESLASQRFHSCCFEHKNGTPKCKSLQIRIQKNQSIFFGCLGAFFSILCKAGKLEYDCEAGVFLNILEVVSRFFAAAISAYLAGQLFEADLLFTALKSTQVSSVVPLIYFVAGFSERLVPSIVSTLGTKEKTEEKNNDT